MVCKVRGILLNYNASKLVNFERIKDMMLRSGYEPQTTVNVHTEKKMKRKWKGAGLVLIVTEPEDKMYRISFFKGRRLGDHTSVPFGYKQEGFFGERCTILACLSMSDDLKFKHPFTCIISGPSGSGKSSFCVHFLQNLAALCTERDFNGGMIWCYSERTAVPSPTDLPKRDVHCNEGVPTDFKIARGRPCLVILDDLLNDVYSKQVCDLFKKGSHHRNISVILITQNLFDQGSYCRTFP